MADYIDYNANDIRTRMAHLLRLYYIRQNTFGNTGRTVAGRNMAVILSDKSVSGGQFNMAIAAVSDPDGDHSEPSALRRLTDLVANSRPHSDPDTIKQYINDCAGAGKISLYTERAPCTTGAGMKDCAGFLARNYPSIPVSYSFQYPSSGKQELDEVISIHNYLGLVDEADTVTLREFFRNLGRDDRAAVTKTLKLADAEIKANFRGTYQPGTGARIEATMSDLGYLAY